MQEDPEIQAEIVEHVRAAVRPAAETARLTRDLTSYCWPGETSDRTDPVARGWLRMWGPIRLMVDLPACGCADGHCRICH